MHIFVDEAGIFIDPANTGKHNVSIFGALVVSHQFYEDVLEKFKILKQKWNYEGEVKGSKIKEEHVDELVEMLLRYDVIFAAVMTDSKTQSIDVIEKHKQNYVQHILKNISEHHHPNVVKQLTEFSNSIGALSNQLYVQSVVMTELIYNTHQLSTLYYVQKRPQELATFRWIIDAKDKNKVTKAEKLWREISMFCIQGKSLKEPLIMLSGADYSFYKKFDGESSVEGNIKAILADVRFMDSANNDALQLVDIVTTCLKKAMNNNFQQIGWRRIGRLMVFFKKPAISLVAFNEETSSTITVPYASIVHNVNNSARRVLLD